MMFKEIEQSGTAVMRLRCIDGAKPCEKFTHYELQRVKDLPNSFYASAHCDHHVVSLNAGAISSSYFGTMAEDLFIVSKFFSMGAFVFESALPHREFCQRTGSRCHSAWPCSWVLQ